MVQRHSFAPGANLSSSLVKRYLVAEARYRISNNLVDFHVIVCPTISHALPVGAFGSSCMIQSTTSQRWINKWPLRSKGQIVLIWTTGPQDEGLMRL